MLELVDGVRRERKAPNEELITGTTGTERNRNVDKMINFVNSIRLCVQVQSWWYLSNLCPINAMHVA